MLVFLPKCYVCWSICLVAAFAKEKIQPLVREMDEKSEMPDSLIRSLFEHGVSVRNNDAYV